MNDFHTVRLISSKVSDENIIRLSFKIFSIQRTWSKGMLLLFLENLEKFPNKAVRASDIITNDKLYGISANEMLITYFIALDVNESHLNIQQSIEKALTALELELAE